MPAHEGEVPGGHRFGLRSVVRLHWRNWDDEWVVFDEASGETHLVSTVTAFALSSIEAGPQALVQLTAELAAAAGLPVGEAESALVAAIDELGRHGLVESLPR